jgi:tRNA1Val (adenine37-N6)-methyltransferase
MPNNHFRFKQFVVHQEKSAMKVGTDGVLLGAWTSIGSAKRILDIGTGTGLIALMLAQRSNVPIDAVEIDEPACEQAKENVQRSRWASKISVYCKAFQAFEQETNLRYDLIVSNPPYFVESLKSPEIARTIARHTALLPHSDLLKGISNLLDENGRFAGIFPYVEGNVFIAKAVDYSLYCSRRTEVKGKTNGKPIRVLLEFSRERQPMIESSISIREVDGSYTPDYITLTKDFYLAF